MHRSTVGYFAGIFGGIVKILSEQIFIFLGLSSYNTIISYARALNIVITDYFMAFIVYIIIAGLIGYITCMVLPTSYFNNFLASSIIFTILIWSVSNITLTFAGNTDTAWNLGFNNMITNLISNWILGLIIFYAGHRYIVEHEYL